MARRRRTQPNGEQAGAASVAEQDLRAALAEAERRAAAAEQRAHAAEHEVRVLQALSDTALSHLSLDDLLRELTERVHEAMGVDNVAILLPEAGGQALTLRAVRGPEEQVAPNVRVPIGQGFAGRIAASGEPLVVNDLAQFDVVNSFLREHLRSALGVPLRAHGRVLGVVHVATAEPHHFTEHDVALLQRVAARAALAVDRAQLFEAARRARREAEARAREQESIFDAMSDGIFVYDQDGRILQINAACRKLLGVAARPDYLALPLDERIPLVQTRDAQGRALPEEQWPQRRVLRGEVLAGEQAADYLLRALDGREIMVNVCGGPIRDAEGRITAGILMLRDVTEERQLQRESAERAALLEATFEAMVDAVFVYDREERLVRMNSAGRRLLGVEHLPLDYQERPPREHLKLFQAVTPTGDTEEAVPSDQRFLRRLIRGEVVTSEEREVTLRRLDGSEVLLSRRGAPIHGPDGQVVGAVAVAHDVTERRDLERRTGEALGALLQMARVLVEPNEAAAPGDAAGAVGAVAGAAAEAPSAREIAHRLAALTCDVLGCRRVGIQVIEPETRRIRALAVVGLSPEQERQWWIEQEASTARYGAGADPALLARFEAGEAIVVDMTAPPYDQLPNPYGVTTSLTAPMRIGGAVVGILALDYGGTRHTFLPHELALAEAVAQLSGLVIERDRLLREREEARARELALLTINQHMDDFLSMAAHDLRSPVAGAKLVAQTAQRRVRRLTAGMREAAPDAPPELLRQSAELERALDGVTEQMDRMARLVDRLLDVSRARTGKLEVNLEPCDLAAVVRDCVEQQRALAPTRRIELDLPHGLAVLLAADATRIAQVVTNYLTNAVRYSEANAPVFVSLAMDGQGAGAGVIRVAVRDEGPGIPPTEREAIWARFERAKGVKQKSGTDTGLGLGLYISRSIIERHGGQVGVESEEGRGSTFWFTLPLAPGAAE